MATNEQIFNKLLEVEAKLNKLLEALAAYSEDNEIEYDLEGQPIPGNRRDLQEL